MVILSSNGLFPSPALPRAHRENEQRGPVFAVVEIDAQESFKPKNSDCVPCDGQGFGGVPAELICRYAAIYNADQHSKQKHRWACVAMNGAVFFLANIDLTIRPPSPEDFPPGCRTGLTFDEAVAIQTAENDERLKIARIPRRWTIAIRPLALPERDECLETKLQRLEADLSATRDACLNQARTIKDQRDIIDRLTGRVVPA